MKKIMLMLVAVMLNCFVGAIAAPFIGLTPLEGGAGLVVLSAAKAVQV